MGLALGGDDDEGDVGALVNLWADLGEPFQLLDSEARETKVTHLLSRWAELDPGNWSRDVADYWGNLSDDERSAIVERRKHGRRKNSAGVKGWISDQMRIKAAFARRDAAAEARDDGPSGRSSSTRSLTYAEREALRQRFRDSAYRWGEPGGGVGDPMDFNVWLERRAAGELENDGDGPDYWVAAIGGQDAD